MQPNHVTLASSLHECMHGWKLPFVKCGSACMTYNVCGCMHIFAHHALVHHLGKYATQDVGDVAV
jgi:hypothetical protein